MWLFYFGWLFIWISFCGDHSYYIWFENRHQDYCYYRAAIVAASAFGAVIVVFRTTSLRLLCIDETFPFFIPSRRRLRFVCTQNCYYYHFLNVHRLLQFSFRCWHFLCLDRTLSYLLRSQLVFKCSQLTRYWHTLIHSQTRRLTTISETRLCALFSFLSFLSLSFSLSLTHSHSLRTLCFTQKYHLELNDRMLLEMCLNNLFRKMIFLRPQFSAFFGATISHHNHQWVIDNWERYSDFPNRRSLEI